MLCDAWCRLQERQPPRNCAHLPQEWAHATMPSDTSTPGLGCARHGDCSHCHHRLLPESHTATRYALGLRRAHLHMACLHLRLNRTQLPDLRRDWPHPLVPSHPVQHWAAPSKANRIFGPGFRISQGVLQRYSNGYSSGTPAVLQGRLLRIMTVCRSGCAC
jgi:hypothetical protein